MADRTLEIVEALDSEIWSSSICCLYRWAWPTWATIRSRTDIWDTELIAELDAKETSKQK